MQDFRSYLKTALLSRRQIRKRYSLRAFARDLGVSASFLSDVINAKRGLSNSRAAAIGKKLELPSNELKRFIDLVSYANADSDTLRQVIKSRLREQKENFDQFTELGDDFFRVISSWHHFAILDLTELNLPYKPTRLAKLLNVSSDDVQQAVARLKKMNLIEEKEGRLIRTCTQLTTTQDVPSEAIRQFHRQVLSKARDGLLTNPVQERDFGAIFMTLDPQRVDEAKTKIGAFRRELFEFLEGGEKKELYCLSTQFFRLTQSPLAKEVLLS